MKSDDFIARKDWIVSHLYPKGTCSASLHCAGERDAFGDPLFPTVGKVGKRTGRNQWFLHFLACYNVYRAELYNNSSFAVEIKMDATAA